MIAARPYDRGMANGRQIAPGVNVFDAPLRFVGVELGTKMTVLQLGAGLLVHSPIAADPSSISHLGEPRWVLAPNRFHHLYVGPWADAGLEAWAGEGLAKKRPDLKLQGVVDSATHPFGDEVALLQMRSIPVLSEVVVLHRPSKTLVTSDFVFNIQKSAPWFTRFAMGSALAYPGCRVSALERFGMKRKIAREEVETILDWDFDRVVMAHGAVIESGGKDAVAAAYSWLL